MASPASEPRGPQACNTCRTRKKACDKLIPSCGYCVKRGILCSYEIKASGLSGGIGTWSARVDHILAPPQTPSEREQIECIIQSRNLSCLEISERYFQSFHLWLPVVSLKLFYTYGATTASSLPPADHSVLVLAMCLITQCPADDSIYMALKIVFVQVQTRICASTPLVQAGLLISTYEYARGWLDAAFISIGTCARMARTIGIDESQGADVACRPWSKVKINENRNIWWGVVVLERVILSESPTRRFMPELDFPNDDSFLPSDLDHLEPSSLEQSPTAVLSDISSKNISSFGRLVQAAYLLTRVVHVVNNTTSEEAKLLELTDLDRDLQAFLSLLMHESAMTSMPHSSAITTAVRALFLLHQGILSLSTNATENDINASSRAALDTAAKMVVDAAHDHSKDTKITHPFPLCCASNIRDAGIQMDAMHSSADDKTSCDGLNVLAGLENSFCARWRPEIQ